MNAGANCPRFLAIVTCLCIFCLQWGFDASVAAQKALEDHCESMLRGRKSFQASILFTSVSRAFVYVTENSSMGLGPSIA